MKKKGVVTLIIVLFFCVAAYLNWNAESLKSDEERVQENFGESSLVVNESEAPDENGNKTNETQKQTVTGETTEYFTEARMEKQKARDSAITTLKEALSEEGISQSSRDSAAESIETISTGAVSETRIETLVKAKGFTDCVALINDDGVNVIVSAPSEGLAASDITKIKDIAVAETKFLPAQIKIIEIK